MKSPREGAAGLSVAEKRALLERLLKEKEAQAQARRLGEDAPGRPAAAAAHRLVEEQAARTPEAAAVAFGDRSLTYRGLDARANRLAHRLVRLGVGPETLVGLGLGRSPGMVVALLAVLKAGGAYVPLDPAFPPDRLAFMVEDARLPVLLVDRETARTLPSGAARVVEVGPEGDGFETEPDTPPAVAVDARALAYVIYTSGSTGRPKGVQVAHGSLVNFLRSMRQRLAMTERDALLAVTTLSFDIAALELLLPLTVGARVELATRAEASDASRLIARLSDPSLTFLQATPATWRLLLDGGWAGAPGLTLLCGGEALPRALADRLRDKGRALWNLYGPTETTIWSSLARVEPEEGPVPIGRAIAATQLHVLDARLRPVPVGVTGELYIGGEGVARGYLNRPALTAERFVPDPFGTTPGARMYRTGDLARWRSDDQLECLGRVDHQVKVRGFRIELGEVESALASHPAVREAAVGARPDASGETALTAYVALRPEHPAPDPAALRAWLGRTLPPYMIPSAYVTLPALPLTPNGKVDRNALPDPDHARTGLDGTYVPPRGPVEEAVAAVWSELLGRDKVGVHDDFFALGGHSLIATQLLARLRDVFAVDPPLREFLEGPTVARLARLVESALTDGTGDPLPPIGKADRAGPLPPSSSQRRLWFLDQLEPGRAVYNIPTAVRLTGDLDAAALSAALDEVVRRHEVLRTTFREEAGAPIQVVGPSRPVGLPRIDLAALPERERAAEARRILAEEAARPFDLARDLTLRARLVRLGEREHLVGVTMHHVAADGWSIGILVRELAVLYEAFRQGARSPLDDLGAQYADFAVWQRGWLEGDALRARLDDETARLEGVPTLDLPTDRPVSSATTDRGATRSIHLPAALRAALRLLGRAEGATPFMTLLAGFETLLHRYTGQTGFAVGSPIAGRTRPELEGLIGFFVNTLVLRADLSGDPSFRTLLGRTRRDALRAFAHQDLPFDRLVEALHPDRDAGRSPLFRVMFAMQNAPMDVPGSDSLALELLETDSGSAKFDLTLSIADDDQGGLSAAIEYATDLFDASTIERMLEHYRTLLEAAAADPDRPVSALALMSDSEERAVLGDGGGPADGDLDEILAELAGEGGPADD